MREAYKAKAAVLTRSINFKSFSFVMNAKHSNRWNMKMNHQSSLTDIKSFHLFALLIYVGQTKFAKNYNTVSVKNKYNTVYFKD